MADAIGRVLGNRNLNIEGGELRLPPQRGIKMPITTEQIYDVAVRVESYGENVGICTACGAERDGCEPDAENYECYECGEDKVQGYMNLIMGVGF